MAKRSSAVEEISRAAHDVELSRARAKHADVNEKYQALLTQLREADDRLNAVMGLKERIEGYAPVEMKVKASGKRGESTAVLVTSDWHLEEKVDPATINGVNEYNPAIATARITKCFQNSLSMVEMCRSRSTIDTLVLLLAGDSISGTIHDDLAESNYLSPTEATLKAYRLACGGIDFLLKEGGFKQIKVVCNWGNHGRTTKKMRCSTAAKNSYEWMMYQLIAERYGNEPRCQFQIADGYFNFVQIYDTLMRVHHGDGVRYQGGVGGLTIPLNKAIAQWNKMRKADIDVIGHWHSRQLARDFVVNGSVIGYNAYSISIKASYEPPAQSFFLVHPEKGKTVEIPIYMN